MREMKLQKKKNTYLKLSKNAAAPAAKVPQAAPVLPDIQIPEFHSESAEIFEPVINFLSAEVPAPKASTLRGLGVFALAAIIIVFGFQTAKIIASGISTKARVLGATSLAFSQLQDAQSLASQKDFLGSEEQFQFAEQNFERASQNVSDLGGIVNSILKITPQGKAAGKLLSAGEQLSSAGVDLNNFYVLLGQVKISPDGFESPDGFYETVNASRKYLDDAVLKLKNANDSLSQLNPSDVPAGYRDQFGKYKERLDIAANATGHISDLLSLLQSFFGKGQKSFLVLFENNNELRPTGGFIGTYGYFKTSDGKITSQKITSVYDLDGQIKEEIDPPAQFAGMTDHWALRDSNWYPDFQESAQNASLFYEKEAGETPDAVVAVTPDLFVDLLKITGPIYFPKYNLTLTSDNFREQIQLNTSVIYDKQINTPKQMLADFAPLLLQKLGDLPDGSRAKVLSALFANISAKNILFYDRDPDIEGKFAAYNWAGQIAAADSDYLAVYNANLNGGKTDLDVKQSLDVKSEVRPDGSILDTVTYTREHLMNLVHQERNKDYVRFLVPQGSKLVSVSGFDEREYGMVKEEESGKTSFGNWIEVSPGEKKTVQIKYVLPFKVDSAKHFSILFQKQPGNNPISLTYQLMQNSKIAWYTPGNLGISDGNISYSVDLTKDIFLGAVFDNNGNK